MCHWNQGRSLVPLFSEHRRLLIPLQPDGGRCFGVCVCVRGEGEIKLEGMLNNSPECSTGTCCVGWGGRQTRGLSGRIYCSLAESSPPAPLKIPRSLSIFFSFDFEEESCLKLYAGNIPLESSAESLIGFC